MLFLKSVEVAKKGGRVDRCKRYGVAIQMRVAVVNFETLRVFKNISGEPEKRGLLSIHPGHVVGRQRMYIAVGDTIGTVLVAPTEGLSVCLLTFRVGPPILYDRIDSKVYQLAVRDIRRPHGVQSQTFVYQPFKVAPGANLARPIGVNILQCI
jgi:hypothetical protein